MRRIGLALLALAIAAGAHAQDSVLRVPGRAVAPYAFVGDACAVVVLGDSIEEIGEGAFAGSSLTEIVIPESVRAIGRYAFADCRNLTKVVIGSGVESLPEAVFKGCCRLNEVVLPSTIRTIGERAFYGTALTRLDLSGMAALDTVADWAFAECGSFVQLYLPESLRHLGTGALMGCESLSGFNLPWKVEVVEDYLFAGDSSLDAAAVLHDNVESMGDYSLSGTKHSAEVVLPEHLNYIGTGAMERFHAMRRLDAKALYTVPQLGDSVWGEVDRSRVVLDVPNALRDDFNTAGQWREFSIATSGIEQELAANGLGVTLSDGNLVIVSPVAINQVRVYDVYGLSLHNSTPRAETTEINLASQPRKVYLVEIATDDGVLHKLKLSDNL